VFLDEIQRFIHSANSTREELTAIRTASKARRQFFCGGGQRGRPRGARRERSAIVEANLTEASENPIGDPHLAFQSYCMIALDHPHLRSQFLAEILFFIGGADKSELAVIRVAVAKRAKRIGKKRGRPGIVDDDELLYTSRLVAWRRIIDSKRATEIATEPYEKGVRNIHLIPPTYNEDGEEIQPGNIQSIRGQLWRSENYLAAMIWDAAPPSYVVQEGAYRGDLKPGALEHKPLQQLIWIRTGFPFRERPEQCKRIVNELWPRAMRANHEPIKGRMAYRLNKKPK